MKIVTVHSWNVIVSGRSASPTTFYKWQKNRKTKIFEFCWTLNNNRKIWKLFWSSTHKHTQHRTFTLWHFFFRKMHTKPRKVDIFFLFGQMLWINVKGPSIKKWPKNLLIHNRLGRNSWIFAQATEAFNPNSRFSHCNDIMWMSHVSVAPR